jgi:hypothetical protein
MSSPTYYNEYDSESEYFEIDQMEYEKQEPYMTYDEEMAAFDDSDNIFEDEYTDDAYNN